MVEGMAEWLRIVAAVATGDSETRDRPVAEEEPSGGGLSGLAIALIAIVVVIVLAVVTKPEFAARTKHTTAATRMPVEAVRKARSFSFRKTCRAASRARSFR